ncbi:MAG TPA: WecB/TagA/CpsF family glycosyltransferase [Roseiflexaceae bacterium]|nr:WecB/TagA/CpsF family glycosyltransferase [Roseiflexaceae bacterium]HMP39512.1 WecB/TagA/CpsF family glycosyltransferase [Roseiflexaceae bacterium]
MIDHGKHNLIGVLVNAIDYEAAIERIRAAALAGQGLAVSALAVHGVMTGHMDAEHRARLNRLDLITPDGQPVRWALKLLHQVSLPDRVYGPNLMLMTCEMAQADDLGIYLYGARPDVLDRLQRRLQQLFPRLKICGAEPSRFRRLSAEERCELVERIKGSGAQITFVGLGCPRQEVWAYEYRDALAMPILAVGAAFDFHAGAKPQAPQWMQDRGLEWLFRLGHEPRRLWWRYLVLNPWYLGLVASQLAGWRAFPLHDPPSITEHSYG